MKKFLRALDDYLVLCVIVLPLLILATLLLKVRGAEMQKRILLVCAGNTTKNNTEKVGSGCVSNTTT